MQTHVQTQTQARALTYVLGTTAHANGYKSSLINDETTSSKWHAPWRHLEVNGRSGKCRQPMHAVPVECLPGS
eukprot:2235349-Pleurochrysis_carterae.AAC.1